MPRYAHHERLRAYQSIEQLVSRLRTRDHQLALVARGRIEQPRDDRPDGYPRGGDGGGRMSGVSDPTGSAVEQRNLQADRLREHADDAMSSVFEALKALVAADAAASKALDPPKFADEQKKPAVPLAIWCVSCARLLPKEHRDDLPSRAVGESIAFNPRHQFTKRSRTDLCSWCLKEWDASGNGNGSRKLPDIRLVIWRADHANREVTERVRAQVLAPRRRSQPV